MTKLSSFFLKPSSHFIRLPPPASSDSSTSADHDICYWRSSVTCTRDLRSPLTPSARRASSLTAVIPVSALSVPQHKDIAYATRDVSPHPSTTTVTLCGSPWRSLQVHTPPVATLHAQCSSLTKSREIQGFHCGNDQLTNQGNEKRKLWRFRATKFGAGARRQSQRNSFCQQIDVRGAAEKNQDGGARVCPWNQGRACERFLSLNVGQSSSRRRLSCVLPRERAPRDKKPSQCSGRHWNGAAAEIS
jgi:hypothetical protein